MGGSDESRARLDGALERLDRAAAGVRARRPDPGRVADAKARLDAAIADLRRLLEA